MSPALLLNILNKVFVREFYRMNSGFFLLVGTLAFGFMSDVEHVALARFFVSTTTSVLVPIAIWVLYALKILHFNTGQLNTDFNSFIFNLQFLSYGELILLSLTFVFFQFLPAIVYGCFLIITAWQISAYQSIWIIASSLITLWISAAHIMFQSFRNPGREKKTSFIKRFLDRHFVKSIIQFYAEWVLRKDPLMVAATKALTVGLLVGVSALYRYEAYDWRFIAMAVTVCVMANLLIVFHLVKFEHLNIVWIKNLPIELPKRFARLIATLAIFLLPEITVLIRHFPQHLGVGSMLLVVAYLLGLISFLLGLLHTSGRELEHFTKQTFWIFTLLILAILFKVPLILLILTGFAAGYIMFHRNYYSHERMKS